MNLSKMLLNFTFKIIKGLNLLDYYFETKIKRLLLKPKHVLLGNCSQCAACCEKIACEIPSYFTNRFVLGFIIAFIEHLNDFKYLYFIEDTNMLIFSCNNFDAESRTCLSYQSRPAVCRNYPLVRYFERPVLIKGCGYKVQ